MTGEVNLELRQEVQNQLDQDFAWQRLEDGLNSVYELSSGDTEYVLKERTNPKTKIEWFRAEPRIYEAINKINVPSPEIIYQDFSTASYENVFYVMEKMPGSNPQQMKDDLGQEEFEEIIFQYGRMLGRLHKINLGDKYGIQGFEDGEFVSSEPNEKWSESIEEAMSSWQSTIRDEWNNPPEISYNSEKVKEVVPDKPKPVLVHDDNRLDNILLTGTDTTGFIDWSTSWAGHDQYDLLRAKYLLIEYDLRFWGKEFNERELEEKLYEGYKQEADLKIDENYRRNERVYRYASALWLASGFVNWGENLGTEEHDDMKQELTTRLKQEQKALQKKL